MYYNNKIEYFAYYMVISIDILEGFSHKLKIIIIKIKNKKKIKNQK